MIDYADKKKFEKYNKGIFILIQRYPECIEICPKCGNIIYSKIEDKKGFKDCRSQLEFEMEKIQYFRCGICDKRLYGNKFLYFKEDTQKVIKEYLKCRYKEEQNFYDFFYHVVEPLIMKFKKSEEELHKMKNI